MVSAGSYILAAVLLAALTLSLGFSAVRLRRWLMPDWEGAPAHLIEAIVGVALLIWLSELLGLVNLLYAGTLVAAALFLAAAVALCPRVLSRGEPPAGDALRRGKGWSGLPGRVRRPVFRRADSARVEPRPAKNPAPPNIFIQKIWCDF